jgi:hypothetical protein
MLLGGPILNTHGRQIIDLTAKSRLPAIYERPNDVEAGGLMSYSANTDDLARRAATYVDKILKGAEPADLPVEQPTKVPRIGYLSGSSISANPHWREAFQQGLHDLGYLPGLQSVE